MGASMLRLHRQRGQAIVEMALIFPIVLFIAMIGAAGSQMLQESILLRTAAREGALTAALYMQSSTPLPAGCAGGGASITDAQDCARYRVVASGAPTSVTVTWTQVTGAQSSLTMAQVAVTDTIVPAAGFFGNRTIGYTAAAAVPGQ
jgi:Flp pilus assembly protein TadG